VDQPEHCCCYFLLLLLLFVWECRKGKELVSYVAQVHTDCHCQRLQQCFTGEAGEKRVWGRDVMDRQING